MGRRCTALALCVGHFVNFGCSRSPAPLSRSPEFDHEQLLSPHSELLDDFGERPLPFRFVRHLPVHRHEAAHCPGLRAGVVQTLKEETAGQGAVVRARYGAMAIVGAMLVLAATVSPVHGLAVEHAAADCRAVVDVNLTPVLLCCRAAILRESLPTL
jgi:hypothetical protein